MLPSWAFLFARGVEPEVSTVFNGLALAYHPAGGPPVESRRNEVGALAATDVAIQSGRDGERGAGAAEECTAAYSTDKNV